MKKLDLNCTIAETGKNFYPPHDSNLKFDFFFGENATLADAAKILGTCIVNGDTYVLTYPAFEDVDPADFNKTFGTYDDGRKIFIASALKLGDEFGDSGKGWQKGLQLHLIVWRLDYSPADYGYEGETALTAYLLSQSTDEVI